MTRFLIAIAAAALISGGAHAGSPPGITTVSLRTTARVDVGTPVTLGEIATIEGPDAELLGAVVIEPDPDARWKAGRWFRIDAEQVRDILENLDGVAHSACQLVGRATDVGSHGRRPEKAREEKVVAAGDTPQPESRGPPTVRDAVLARLAQLYNTREQDLRVEFSSTGRDILDLSTESRVVSIRPTGTSDRVPLEIVLYEGERIIDSATVRADVLIRRKVTVMMGVVRRGGIIAADDLRTEPRWVRPTTDPASLDAAAGSIARKKLDPGTMIESHHIEAPIIVGRGDLVSVHSYAGSIAIKTTARSLSKARDGEVIEFESIDTGARFRARMSGRGRAVVVHDQPPEMTP